MLQESDPVLYFVGCDEHRWNLCATVVAQAGEHPPSLRIEEGQVPPVKIAEEQGMALWRYDFYLRRGEPGFYAYGGQAYRVQCPAPGEDLRFALTACNGTEDENPARPPKDRNVVWADLAKEHEEKGFHLLIQCGDHIYADQVWSSCPELERWHGLPEREQVEASFSKTMDEATARFYWNQYLAVRTLPEISQLMARVPSLMMWDDHDIMDGWGSHSKVLQQSPVMQGVFTNARCHFQRFQMPTALEEPEPHHFGWFHRIDDLGLIAPDLRSERTPSQILGSEGWEWFRSSLQELEGCKRLFVVLTVPFVNVDLSALERFAVAMPGQFKYEDDLRDQWLSFVHRDEWDRMAKTLLGFAEHNGAHVTILSGEIHLAAQGILKRNQTEIRQLIAPGVAHPAPPAAYRTFLECLAPAEATTGGVTRRLEKLPGQNRYYVNEQGWLELTAGPQEEWAVWHTERGASERQDL